MQFLKSAKTPFWVWKHIYWGKSPDIQPSGLSSSVQWERIHLAWYQHRPCDNQVVSVCERTQAAINRWQLLFLWTVSGISYVPLSHPDHLLFLLGLECWDHVCQWCHMFVHLNLCSYLSLLVKFPWVGDEERPVMERSSVWVGLPCAVSCYKRPLHTRLEV